MADNTTVRFGIIGCAEIARKIIRAINLSPNATLSAIASRSIQKAKSFAHQNGLPDAVKVYGSYDEVLDDPEVDAVYMPLPTSLHVEWGVSAARKKKHVLVEKPTALDVAGLDAILGACESSGVQFMDGTMWLHHPRTAKMKELMCDAKLFGRLNYVNSMSTFSASHEFFESNIRVKPELDALGALGDVGWYSIGTILWAADYKLPTSAAAIPDVVRNSAGVIISCSASLYWAETIATFRCSFLENLSMELVLIGSNGSIRVKDLTIPFEEDSAFFDFTPGAKLVDLHIGWNVKPDKVQVSSELPQEALMIKKFASIVEGIKQNGNCPEIHWPEISRKTQLVLDAIKKSIDNGFELVYL